MLRRQNRDQKSYDLNYLASASWELELLVSGIVLLLLFQSEEFTQRMTFRASSILESEVAMVFGLLILWIPFAILTTKVVFIIHVLVRGLWIGALGLRSVSDDIDLEPLKLNKWFLKFLSKYQGNFDPYIHRLEKLASILFSFNFLLLFYMFSILLSIGWVALSRFLADQVSPIFVIIEVYLIIAMILAFLDFVTLQRLKRGRFAFAYYPFYRVLTFLNLSILYRSLHYNFIDFRYTRRLIILVMVGTFCYFILAGFNFHLSPWMIRVPDQGSVIYNPEHYDDQRNTDFIVHASIGKYYNDRYLELTIPIRESPGDRDFLMKVCPGLEEYSNITWYDVHADEEGFHINTGVEKVGQEHVSRLLSCYLKPETILIDDVEMFPETALFVYTSASDLPQGLRMVVDISNLSDGPHILRIGTTYLKDEGEEGTRYREIPFFKKSPDG